MAVSKTMENAVLEKDLGKIYSSFYTILLSDPGFTTTKFDEAFRYVKSKNIEGFLQEHNGEPFAPMCDWNQQYWDKVASALVDNFSTERINHLKQVGKAVYSIEEAQEPAGKDTQKKTEAAQLSEKPQTSNIGKLIAVSAAILLLLIIVIVLLR